MCIRDRIRSDQATHARQLCHDEPPEERRSRVAMQKDDRITLALFDERHLAPQHLSKLLVNHETTPRYCCEPKRENTKHSRADRSSANDSRSVALSSPERERWARAERQ